MARNTYEVDEELEIKLDWSKFKRLGKYLLPYKKTVVFIILLMSSASIATMFIPVIFMDIMDNYIPNKDMQGIIRMAIFTLMICLYSAFILRVRSRIMAKMGQNIIYNIREDIFKHIQKLPFSYFDNRPHGKIQVRVVNYVNSLSDLLSNGIVNTLTELGSLIFVIIFMFSINIRLTIICMLGLPFLITLIIYIKSRQRKAWQTLSNKQSNLNAYIAESINGVRITQSFVREKENMTIFNRLSGAYRDSWLNAVKYSQLMSPAVDNISAVTTSAIFLLGVYWIDKGAGITAGTLIAFNGFIGRFWTPINTLASFYNSLINAVSYIERIFETIDEPVEIKDKENAKEMPEIKGNVEFKNVEFKYEEDGNPILNGVSFKANQGESFAKDKENAKEMPEIKGNVEFKNVEFKYEEDGNPILNGVSFKANQGESFAIVGPTGAGKTTIVNLLSRFYNINSGEILVDGINIEDVTIKSLRTQMGVMMQESFIFSGTIMDNIRYGNKDATDEEVISAAKVVCAHDFIMEMEKGYETEVKERGSGLSAGQKQLISFARALLANPKILILDEATSSIDTETEIALQNGLKNLLENRTSFIIAHRLSTIKNCDCILYVDKGQIAEKGSHQELLDKKGKYYNLYMSQYEFLKKE